MAGLIMLTATLVEAAEFSARARVVTGDKAAESKFFFSNDSWRIEESRPQGEFRITIFQKDHKSLVVLWPEKKRYFIQQLPEKEFKIIATRKPGEEIEKQELGRGKILGYETTKYRVTYDVQGRTMTSIEWFSKEFGVVIRSQAEDNTWQSEITNIKEGRQDGALFEIPKGYQRLSDKDIFKAPQSP